VLSAQKGTVKDPSPHSSSLYKEPALKQDVKQDVETPTTKIKEKRAEETPNYNAEPIVLIPPEVV